MHLISLKWVDNLFHYTLRRKNFAHFRIIIMIEFYFLEESSVEHYIVEKKL